MRKIVCMHLVLFNFVKRYIYLSHLMLLMYLSVYFNIFAKTILTYFKLIIIRSKCLFELCPTRGHIVQQYSVVLWIFKTFKIDDSVSLNVL